MLKFLRRVFVILVLLFVVFVIFRIVNPTATANFVDKIRSVPQKIFHRNTSESNTDGDLIIDGKTTSLSGDVSTKKDKKNKKENPTISDSAISTVTWDSIDDFLWLDELEKNTSNMLWIDQESKDLDVDSVIQETSEKLNQIAKDNLEPNGSEECMSVDEIKDYVEGLVADLVNSGNINASCPTVTEIATPKTTTNTSKNTNASTKNTVKKRTNCCDANCVLSESECAEVNMIWKMVE